MAIADWEDMMAATVTYKYVVSRDAYGEPTFSDGVDYIARWTQKYVRITSRVTGDDVIASSTVWLDGYLTSLNIDSVFVLPDGSSPDILNWETVSDENGPHHTKVFFK